MSTATEIKVFETGSKEAHDCMARHNVLYDAYGQPMASVYFVFPHLLTLQHPKFRKKRLKKSRVARMRKIAKLIAPLLADLDSNEDDAIFVVLAAHKDFVLDLDDEELCAMFNEACDVSTDQDRHGDFIGYAHAQAIFSALQKLDDKFGEHIFGPHYTYNDSDSYAGQHDIQVTMPSESGDPWTPQGCDIIFLQIHPGGDARNMAEGRFYVPEGIDETTDIFDTLGAHGAGELFTTVEIPVEFPLEQWIQQVDPEAWESIDREESPDDDGHWKRKDVLPFFSEFKDGLCQTQLCPRGENGAGVDVYRCYDVAAYKGSDFWTWVPQGEVVGEKRSNAGLGGGTVEFKYSSAGYFKWEGPMPGTPEWDTMMAENELTPIEPRKPRPVIAEEE